MNEIQVASRNVISSALGESSSKPVAGRDFLRDLAHGYYFSCALYAAVGLGIADVLASGPLSVEQIASEKRVNPEMLVRLLRFLGSIGIFTEDADNRFSLTPTGEFLKQDHPRSVVREVSMFAGDEVYQAWGSLRHSVETGQPAFDKVFGAPMFEYFKSHPDTADRFHAAWQEITTAVATETVEAFELKDCSTIIDVGCGNGVFVGTLLQKHKHLKAVLYDLPVSLTRTKEVLAGFGVEDRATIIAGDAREHVPPGGDVYFLKSVIHSCDDAQTVKILKNCEKVLPERGSVVVIERVIPDGPQYHWSRMVDMTMMVMTGGRERTRSDYISLYAHSGLVLSSVLDLPSGFSLVKGVRSGARAQ